jgi:Tol biopolymer transport system component
VRALTRSIAALAACASLLVGTTAALATDPGENGKILFVSGRGGPADNDSGADVYILSGPEGTVKKLTSADGQHRHPDWSPDLKRVAYALWASASDRDIWIHDLGDGSRSRGDTITANVTDDRPAWSNDGTRIAYESEVTNASGQMDILVTNLVTHQTTNITQTPNFIEGKPVWSRDDEFIYFSKKPKAGGNDDIVRKDSDGSGNADTIIFGGAEPVYQPAISPGGGSMCYTRGAYGTADADIWVANLLGPQNPFNLSDSNIGAFNCTWSPDARFVAYVNGVFTDGALVYERSDDSGTRKLMTTDIADHFDGNPAWAPKRPALCQGEPATIVGTDGPNVLVGTKGRDVFAAHGGPDTIKGLSGDDLACGGGGSDSLRGGDDNDILLGGARNDVLRGSEGDDTLRGGSGKDTCLGGAGADVTTGCE